MSATVSHHARDLLDELGSWEEVLVTLRGEGGSKVDAIRATVEVLDLPLADAKVLVHDSEAWADRRTADEAFHDDLLDAALTDTSQ